MIKLRLFKLSVTMLLSASIIIGGCNASPNTIEPVEPPPIQTQPSEPIEEPKKIEPEIVQLSIDPDHIIIQPGSMYKMSIQSTYSDHTSKLFFPIDQRIILTTSNPETITVNEQGIIYVSEEASIGTTATVTAQYEGITAEASIMVKYSLEDTVEADAVSKPKETKFDIEVRMVSNPAAVAVMVNKNRGLSKDYRPEDLVIPDVPFSFSGTNERSYMRSEAAAALEQLFKQAKEEDIELTAVSGYRTYHTQEMLFKNYVMRDGFEKARQYSAYPGTSEHQTGLAMDVSTPSIDNRIGTSANFGETKEGKWLAENAPAHGFVIRYPQGKEHITGYVYEPWHLRYLGVELAQLLTEQELAMEEFFEESTPVTKDIE